MTMMDEQKSAQRDAGCRDEQTAGSAPEGALSRRSFLAGATIVGAAACGLGLAGCAVQESEPEPATDPGPVTDANLTPGTYQGSARQTEKRGHDVPAATTQPCDEQGPRCAQDPVPDSRCRSDRKD